MFHSHRLVFGYAFPAYECYKSVEMNKPDIHQLRFWCQYWILVAGLTICERISDLFIGWVPMYGEAKLAFFIYLWFPKTKGTTYVYDSFFRPYVAKHETEIDRNLLELKTRAGDVAVLYSQRAASYVQTRFFDILQYIASQSTPKRPAQPRNEATKLEEVISPVPSPKSAPAPAPAPTPTTKPQEEQPSSPSCSGKNEEMKEKSESSDNVKAPPTILALPSKESNTTEHASICEEEQGRKISSTTASVNGNTRQACVEDIVMGETRRATRARARKTKAASIR